MNKIFLLFVILIHIYAFDLDLYINKQKCDQIIDKKIFKICYSYKYKGALAGWTILYGNLVDKKNIKKRCKFYSEKTIIKKYRTNYKDYTGYGKQYNRGHFIVSDADCDYDKMALYQAYTMANIIPQVATLNQRTWIKVERYGRILAKRFGYVYSISIAEYTNLSYKIGNDIVIPTKLYRIYYNDKFHFEK